MRAVHLEIGHSLNTDSAILAFKRFMAFRSIPIASYSDNGTNFKGMCRELKDAIILLNRCGGKLEEFAARNKFYWYFNPPAAPHMGGVWESLIKTVKTAITAATSEICPREETLQTIFAEVMHTVNSRPLTHVSLDPRDKEALTPNHFLIGSSSGAIKFSGDNKISPCTRKQWKICEMTTEIFWKRWLQEYLPTLIPRKKGFWKEEVPITEGDIVLVLDDQIPRNQWRKGVVTRIHPSKDGESRMADVKTALSILLRPTRKLVKFSHV